MKTFEQLESAVEFSIVEMNSKYSRKLVNHLNIPYIPGNILMRFSKHSIEIGLREDRYNMVFASSVTIYKRESMDWDNIALDKIEISYGSSGSFDTENEAAVFRTLLAASLVQNFSFAEAFAKSVWYDFSTHMERVRIFREMIERSNKKNEK